VPHIRELAIKEVPATDIAGIDLENENNAHVYKVKLANGTILSIDAKTGKVLNKDEHNSSTPIPAAFVPGIDFNKAREVALTQIPSGIIEKIELGAEEGKQVYSVRFVNAGRVDISAVDGAVVRVKQPEAKKQSSSPAGSSQTTAPTTTAPAATDNHSTSSHGTEDSSHHSGSGSSPKDDRKRP
jgi:uncharacterized membrane protein YkoI